MHKNNNPFDQSMRDLSIMRGFGEIVPSPKKFKYFLSNSIFYPTKGVFHAEIWETRRIRGVSSFIWSICKGFSLLYVLYVQLVAMFVGGSKFADPKFTYTKIMRAML